MKGIFEVLIATGVFEKNNKFWKKCKDCDLVQELHNFTFRKIDEKAIFTGRDKRKLEALKGPSVSNECKDCITIKNIFRK